MVGGYCIVVDYFGDGVVVDQDVYGFVYFFFVEGGFVGVYVEVVEVQ